MKKGFFKKAMGDSKLSSAELIHLMRHLRSRCYNMTYSMNKVETILRHTRYRYDAAVEYQQS